MRSFSSTTAAGDFAEAMARAEAAVSAHPQALFSDFQWFLYEARDTVFFTAASTIAFDKEKLVNIVADMVSLAPQLTHGFVGARPGQAFPAHILDAITSVEYVDEFDGYPEKWLGVSADIFEHKDLPLFRVMSAVRRGGPDAQGRVSMIQVRSAHAVLEGSDSALILRAHSAAKGVMADRNNKVPLWQRALGAVQGWITVGVYIVLANLLAREEKPPAFRTLAIKRHRLRIIANRLGVRQRSLMFAIVTYALNGEGPKKHVNHKAIAAAYTMLDGGRRTAVDDEFFRVRMMGTKFRVNDDFVAYVRAIDDAVGKAELKDLRKMQAMMNSFFSTFRGLVRAFPFVLNNRLWRFGPVDVILTLVPPHRTYGPMTHGLLEPIYCGAWHSAINLVTFCPSREYVTFSFTLDPRLSPGVDKIEALMQRIEAMDIAPSGRAVADEAA